MAVNSTDVCIRGRDASSISFNISEPVASVSLRRFPYPFRAMLAVCSDLDETPNRHVYWETLRFLNTEEPTTMGVGVGLEVGNSIYFDMPADQFSYWNTDDAGRAMIRNLIRSGHIDCLHSFGDFARTREHAGRALDELIRQDCRVRVWIDHAVAPSNFGSDIMQGYGDVRHSEVYHADLTCSYGIQYVWRGRVSSVIGQNVARSLRGIYNRHHPVASAKTTLKEFFKGLLAYAEQAKYAMHARNHVLGQVQLRSGQQVSEFLRANPHWGGVGCGATADRIPEVLNESMLNRLITCGGVCILYTHLGKIGRQEEPFGPKTQNAFRQLAAAQRDGHILVATTRRLLDYHQMLNNIAVKTEATQDGLRLLVTTERQDQSDYSGLSFYVPDSNRTDVVVNGKEIKTLQRNAPDDTQQESVTIPWPRLEFPQL